MDIMRCEADFLKAIPVYQKSKALPDFSEQEGMFGGLAQYLDSCSRADTEVSMRK